jgi:hypothetical protein
MNEKLEALLLYCKEKGRVCPMPVRWNELYELLPNKKQVGAGWIPALPLILAAWYEPDLSKMLRLEEHLKWASNNNALNNVDQFLRKLPESEWFHFGD